MLLVNASEPDSLPWQPEANPDAADIARRFIAGERDLMLVDGAGDPTAGEIGAFLDVAGEHGLTVHRTVSGEVLLRAGSQTLFVTGRTAAVLRGYLDDQPVRMKDRFDMTVRRAPSRP